MKETFSLISLNCWNGRQFDDFIQFLKETKASTDIYCFQEMMDGNEPIHTASGSRHNLLAETKEILRPTHTAFINRQQFWQSKAKTYSRTHGPWGLAIIHGMSMSRRLAIESWTNTFIVGSMDACTDTEIDIDQLPVVLQKICYVTAGGNRFTVFNFHGYYAGYGIGKGDTEVRFTQAKAVVTELSIVKGARIICGDFNMSPESNSLGAFEWLEGKNLIKEYNIPTTRTALYGEEKRVANPFADYIFTKGMTVESFRVDAQSKISDHAPMFLTFSVGQD